LTRNFSTRGRIFGVPSSKNQNGSAQIFIDNPSKKNAMNLGMYGQIPAVVEEVLAVDSQGTSALRSVVISGVSGSVDFGAGSDISEFPFNRTGAEQSARYSKLENTATEALLAIPVPLIAAIQGACIGGGLNIALTADVRIATESSKFAVPPAR
jgi:enoyl-CoA hydratase